jgi:outer membrane protein OmpA-like peptidoglycan-associated protein
MRFFALLLLIIASSAAQARLQTIVANEHESKWVVDNSPIACRLNHEIPYYGTATFFQQAGSGLEFVLTVRRRPLKSGEARVTSVAPEWKYDEVERDLGKVKFRDVNDSVHMEEAASRRLLLELYNGMFPTFSYQDWVDGADEVKVALSAVNVRSALGDFLGCLDALLPYDYEHIRYSQLYFDFNKSTLTSKTKKRLDKVASYLVADDSIAEIVINGHTDSRGFRNYNQRLGMQRAESVRTYLVGKGIDISKFRLLSYGEKKPAASNRTSKGRANNRRVVINVLK